MTVGLGSKWTWMHGVVAAAMAAAGVIATYDAWGDIWQIATTDEESSHIFLVPFIAAWLVWMRRGRLRWCRSRALWIGPAVIAVGWLTSSFGYNHAMQSLWHGGSVLVVVGCALSVLGRDALKYFMPALVVLVFLVPVPGMVRQEIAIPLQRATALVTQNLLEVFGMPITRSGSLLSINGVDIGIAEACNGLRMVFALVLVSYGFAFGTPLRMPVRILIVAASPISAIICNVIRLVPTVWLYGYQGQEIGKLFHDVSGWAMLGLAFLMLVGLLQLLKWALIPVVPYTLAQD